MTLPGHNGRPHARVFVVAGEVSGDHLGASLIAAMRSRRPTLDVAGVGGPAMEGAGAVLLRDSVRWGVIGYAEAYLRLPVFAVRFWRLVRAIERFRPDLLVLVDFAGMNREVARHFSGRVPMVYLAPPQTAFRRGRSAARLAKTKIRLLAVLPFEAEAYRRAGADVLFVGHPAVDSSGVPGESVERLRETWGLGDAAVLALLPGSRLQEVRALLPAMAEAGAALHGRMRLRCLIPIAAGFLQREIERRTAPWAGAIRLVEGRAMDVMRVASAAVVASGTATAEAACLGLPMVVVYRVSRVTYWIGSRLVATPDVYRVGFSLPNMVLGRRAVPELLDADANGARIAEEVERLLDNHASRAVMSADLAEVRRRLGAPGVLNRAAEEALRVLDTAGGGTLR